MKAVLRKSLDGPDALKICEIPAAAPGEGEVAIRVAAVSLNFFDTLILRGKYQNRPGRFAEAGTAPFDFEVM